MSNAHYIGYNFGTLESLVRFHGMQVAPTRIFEQLILEIEKRKIGDLTYTQERLDKIKLEKVNSEEIRKMRDGLKMRREFHNFQKARQRGVAGKIIKDLQIKVIGWDVSINELTT